MRSIELRHASLPRYVARFACTAAACESSCCVGWRIGLDEADLERLREVMSCTESWREAFARGVVPAPEPTPREHALLVLREGGSCVFHGEDRLCTVQAGLGEGSLPRVCATFPREVRVVGDRLEIAGSLSCPEIARLLLLQGDALELASEPADRLPRSPLRAVLQAGEESAWLRSIDVVRGALRGLLLAGGASLRGRLAAIGCAADETRAWFHPGAGEDAPARLAAVFARYAAPGTLALLERELAAICGGTSRGATAVLTFLERVPKPPWSPLQALLTQITAAYAARDGATRVGAVWDAYQARRDRWTARHGAAVDRYFTRWAVSYVDKEWYVDASDLVDYARRIFVRVAVLRFLLFSHPALDAVDDEPDAAVRERALDAAAVDVVHRYTRDVEHDAAALGALHAHVREAAPSLAEALFLLGV